MIVTSHEADRDEDVDGDMEAWHIRGSVDLKAGRINIAFIDDSGKIYVFEVSGVIPLAGHHKEEACC